MEFLKIAQGTIFGLDKFDKTADAAALREAMKGPGTKEETIISIIPYRTNKQRQEILDQYKKTEDRNLMEDFKSELTGDFEELVTGLMLKPAIYDATCLHKAMEGSGTDEKTLIEILCTRTNEQLKDIKTAYNSEFKKTLQSVLEEDTSGKFKKFLLAICTASREESTDVNYSEAEADAKKLYNGGEAFWASNEEAIANILTSKSQPHLKITFAEYEKLAGISIEETIKKETEGDLQEGYLTIVKCMQNSAAFFAEKLDESMKGLGTNDTKLMRCIISRSEMDMVSIKKEYQKAYEKPLREAIKSDTGGDYEKLLLALIEGQGNDGGAAAGEAGGGAAAGEAGGAAAGEAAGGGGDAVATTDLGGDAVVTGEGGGDAAATTEGGGVAVGKMRTLPGTK